MLVGPEQNLSLALTASGDPPALVAVLVDEHPSHDLLERAWAASPGAEPAVAVRGVDAWWRGHGPIADGGKARSGQRAWRIALDVRGRDAADLLVARGDADLVALHRDSV